MILQAGRTVAHLSGLVKGALQALAGFTLDKYAWFALLAPVAFATLIPSDWECEGWSMSETRWEAAWGAPDRNP